MIILASSSISRAKILQENRVDFKTISLNYNENVSKNLTPESYVYKVIKLKMQDFFKIYKDKNLDNILVADSIVTCAGKILTKPKNEQSAREMLDMQSANQIDIISGFIFQKHNKQIINISSCTYFFKEFNKIDLESYIKSKNYQNKAGGVMIEGFHKKYIIKEIGSEFVARGLNIEVLKAFL